MTTTTLTAPRLLTPEEVAAALRVQPEAVRRWCRDGLVKAIQTPTGKWRIHASELERLLSGTN